MNDAANTETETDPNHLALPSGGWVHFKGLDDLTGREYQSLKGALTSDPISLIASAQVMMAKIMIDSWSIPGQHNLPLPSTKKGVHSYDQLTWRDMSTIEARMSPLVSKVLFEDASATDDDDEGKGVAPNGSTASSD